VASLAVEEWSDTLLGITRFRSMTELYINWLRRIFLRLLTNVDPDEKSLVTRFNLPYGQASYIARVLREEDTISSRRKWLEKLEVELSRRLLEARQWVKDGRGEETMEFYMHKYARRELYMIIGNLLGTGQPTRQVRNTSTVGDYSFMLICSSDIEKILNEVSIERARLNS